MELADQPCASKHRHSTHDDGTEYAVQQHTALIFRPQGKVAENHQPDKDVVDGERLLDHVAGEEFQRFFIRDISSCRAVEVPPQRTVEDQRPSHPDNRATGRLLEHHFVRLLTAQQVSGNHQLDQGEETPLHPPRTKGINPGSLHER